MANNISIKIDLQKFKGATVMPVGKNQTECIVIPVEMAGLFKGAKGIYADLTAIPLSAPKADSKDTHLVKQSFGKEKFTAMTEDEKKAIPIMGNAIVWGDGGSNTPAAPAAATPPPSWL